MTTETTQAVCPKCGTAGCLEDAAIGFAVPAEDEDRGTAAPLPIFQLPPPVADFGPVRLELMGHRYRQGHLSEVVIAGQPFLRLDLEGGGVEFYQPQSVYCITPGMTPPPAPRAEIAVRFGYMDHDPDEDLTDDDEGLF